MKREFEDLIDIIHEWEISRNPEGIHTQGERKTEQKRTEQNRAEQNGKSVPI